MKLGTGILVCEYYWLAIILLIGLRFLLYNINLNEYLGGVLKEGLRREVYDGEHYGHPRDIPQI
jgi:hypothetical protein